MAARRLKHERADMHEAILAATINWATLEDGMALLLTRLLTPQRFGPGLPIYFTPENTATRFAIVDSVIRYVLVPENELDPLWDTFEGIQSEWGSFFNALGRARGSRNSIIHGVVRSVTVGRSKREVIRLTPSMWDIDRHARLQPGQPPGLSPQQVETAAERIKALKYRAHLFELAAAHYHNARPKLPEALAELVRDRRLRGDLLGDDQMSPKPQGPPPA